MSTGLLSQDRTIETVRESATLVAATPGDTSLVKCRGAKAVHFVVYSTTAGETDAFTEPDILVKAASDVGATAVITSPAATNAYGVIAPNVASCVTAGNVGYVCSVYPDQPGTEVTNPGNMRIWVDQIGIRINAHAANDIATVVALAIVEY